MNADVRNAANTPVVTGSATLNTILAGLSQTVGLNSSFAPTVAGTYRFTTTVAPVPDEVVPTNNTLVQELVVVDTTALTQDLKYTGTTDDGLGLNSGMVAMAALPCTSFRPTTRPMHPQRPYG